MRCAVVLIAVLATSGLVRPPVAGEPAPIDLAALLSEVERASPQLLAIRARAEAAANVPAQKEALPDPILQASYTNDGLSDFTLGDAPLSNLSVGWEQEVPNRSVRARSAAAAQAQAESVVASGATASARLRARVITLYAELWRLDRMRSLLGESRTLLESSAQAVQARYESGEGIQESLIRAQTAVRRVDVDIEELSLERRRAEVALGAAVGRIENAEFGPASVLPVAVGPLDAESLAAATASGPEVLEFAARERAAAAQLDDARVQVKPTFSWLAAYQYRGSLDPMVMGGFSVRLPVWKDRKQNRAIAGASADRTAAAFEREEAEVQTRAAVRGLVADVASIDARLKLFGEALIPQSLSAFESANVAFASGRAELSVVLDDLDRWVGVRREELDLHARRIESLAALEAMTGATLVSPSDPGRSQ